MAAIENATEHELLGVAAEIKHPRKRAFLNAFARTGIVSVAASAAGVHRSTFYEWRARDPKFAKATDDAKEIAVELVEAELRRRALTGVGGKPPSDILLMFMLKRCGPRSTGTTA